MNEDVVRLGLMDDENINLDEAALLLAALDSPEVDLTSYRELLSAMSDELAQRRRLAKSPYEQAVLLASVIGGEYGFQGESESYDDPANADLIAVINRRRGLPVALSIIYVALARRVGWNATALNTPGHVLVRIGAYPQAVVIDPFNEGVIVDRRVITELLVRGGGAPSAPETVPALSNQATLVRLLSNQATRARQIGEIDRALVLYRRMTTIAPLLTGLWWERAELERQVGEFGAARISLNAMLETTRDAALRVHIRATLNNLTRSTH